jgi:hypothetical protein
VLRTFVNIAEILLLTTNKTATHHKRYQIFTMEYSQSPSSVTPMQIDNFKRRNEEELERETSKIQKNDDNPTNFDILLQSIKTEAEKTRQDNRDELRTHTLAINKAIIRMKMEMDTKINRLRDDLNERQDITEKKIDSVTEIASMAHDAITQMKQQNLSDVMDIEGIDFGKYPTQDARTIALEVISSFGIDIHDSDIRSANIKSVIMEKKDQRTNRKLLSVTFHDFQKKLTVMKEKKKSTIKNNIYFNHTMTREVKAIWLKVRRASIDRGIKHFIANGRPTVIINDKKLGIRNEEDMKILLALPLKSSKLQSQVNDELVNAPSTSTPNTQQ